SCFTHTRQLGSGASLKAKPGRLVVRFPILHLDLLSSMPDSTGESETRTFDFGKRSVQLSHRLLRTRQCTDALSTKPATSIDDLSGGESASPPAQSTTDPVRPYTVGAENTVRSCPAP